MGKFGEHPILFCPDGLNHASIPYLKSYLQCPITTNFADLLNPAFDAVLFSWSYLWQDIDWVDKLNKKVVVGGSGVKYLASKGELEQKPNVEYFIGDIDYPEYKETRIMPDYSIPLTENPLLDFLKVYSGYGCNWGKCTFCSWVGRKHTQFNPEYIASVILKANSYGKLASLSAPTHTVDWLVEVEKHLPEGRRYWCYVNAHDNNWGRLKKAKELFIGSEYYSDSVLKRVKKGVTAKKILDSILEILSSGIDVYSTIIEDLYETESELQEHTRNKIDLLSHTAPPKLGWGKLFLGSCKLIDTKHYDCLKQ